MMWTVEVQILNEDMIELYNKIYFVCDIVFYMSGILPQKSAKSPTEFSDSGRDRSA